eukprot:721180_1
MALIFLNAASTFVVNKYQKSINKQNIHKKKDSDLIDELYTTTMDDEFASYMEQQNEEKISITSDTKITQLSVELERELNELSIMQSSYDEFEDQNFKLSTESFTPNLYRQKSNKYWTFCDLNQHE